LYDELQSVANLPLTDSETADDAPMVAWQSMAGQQQRLSQAEALNHEKQQLLERLSLAQADAEQLAQQRWQQNEQLREQLTTQTQLATETGTQYSAAKTKAAATPLPTANPALEQENELLLTQLHQVQEELERYYLENQALKAPARPKAIVPVPVPKLYGAAARIKRQLSYRLGATMIERSRSFGGWLGMPLALAREARQFKREKTQRGPEKLPPIAQYRDAHVAERVKQHLSYRLGQTLVANARSPIGWVKLPWALWGQVRDFRASKQRSPA
jgi:hypothetical protein